MYALLCQDTDGVGYIKIGRSRRVWQRIDALLTGCPIPAKYVAIAKMPNKTMTGRIERRLHKAFKDRKTQGEWFRFDFSNNDDKRVFNSECRKAFNMLRNPAKWEKINLVPILEERERKKELIQRTGYLGKLIRKGREQQKTRSAREELSAYGY